MNECLGCGCYDEDVGCTMPSIDKWYACPLYTCEDELKEMFERVEQLDAGEQNGQKRSSKRNSSKERKNGVMKND